MKSKLDKNNLYENIPQDGRHLAPQKGVEDDYFWGSTLDDETGKARGTGSFRKVDPSELEDGEKKYAEGVATGIGIATALYAVYRFGRWGYGKIKKLWQKKDVDCNEGTELPESTEIVGARVEKAYAAYKERMTNEDARKELVEAYILAITAARKLQRVANAEIVQDNQTIIEGNKMIEMLQKEQLVESINEILLNQPALLEDTYRGLWAEIVGLSKEGEPAFAPLTTERVREYLIIENMAA